MQARQLVVAVVALALGAVARAESIVPCNFVDDFGGAPPARAGATIPAGSGPVAEARPLIPANFVDDFGVPPARAGATAPAGSERVAEARPLIPANFVDDFGVAPPSRAGDDGQQPGGPSRLSVARR